MKYLCPIFLLIFSYTLQSQIPCQIAIDKYNEGKFEEAIEEFLNCTESNPLDNSWVDPANYGDTYFNLSLAYYKASTEKSSYLLDAISYILRAAKLKAYNRGGKELIMTCEYHHYAGLYYLRYSEIGTDLSKFSFDKANEHLNDAINLNKLDLTWTWTDEDSEKSFKVNLSNCSNNLLSTTYSLLKEME